ncbi:GGDEF domain-containing protein [Oceanirhabdus sp. W0125-5]|uniref:GGDEF domain-containing protein n=1 Tax=Oceanirhabdus sp. W0125-5 TaxID=2999116 RepID=UPI0022F313FA|nr:diguanylate cyclase [Oceanirhabdus sp. W0125-5]WBW98321.1 diguanylate cyclase [Oceanirhabdus sp. W0125-5]
MKRTYLTNKDGFWFRISIKFIILFIIFISIHIISFVIIEKSVFEREIKNIKKYEYDITSTQKEIIENKIQNIVLEMRYISNRGNNQWVKINEGLFDNFIEDIKKVSENDKSKKHVEVYDTNGECKFELKYEDKKLCVKEILLENKKSIEDIEGAFNSNKEIVFLETKIKDELINGRIQAISPIIRFGNVAGILIIEYSLEDIANQLKFFLENNKEYTYVFKNNGEVLLRDNKEKDIISENNTEEIKKEWDKISQSLSGQIETANGLITYQTINPVESNNNEIIDVNFKDKQWKIVSYIPLNKNKINFYSLEGAKYLLSEYIKTQKISIFLICLISIHILAYMVLRKINHIKIEEMASLDIMTRTFNRAKGMELLQSQLKKSRQLQEYLTVAFIDINGLKVINDNLGHGSGDELIVNMVNIIKKFITEREFLIRLGGDEFLLILPGINEKEAEERFSEINEHIKYENEHSNKEYNMSFSHGISSCDFNKDTNIFYLINDADEKMYKRKDLMKKNLKILK